MDLRPLHARSDRHRTLTGTVSTALFATITLDFDPVLRLGDSGVRLDTLALAVAAFVALVDRRPARRADADPRPADARLVATPRSTCTSGATTCSSSSSGSIPGAVIGGRHRLRAHPPRLLLRERRGAILDPNQGSLELGLAVLVGTVTGAYVCRLLDAPGRPLAPRGGDPDAQPAIALGELSRVLGGGGQGSRLGRPVGDRVRGPRAVGHARPGDRGPSRPGLRRARRRGRARRRRRRAAARRRSASHDGSAFFVGLLIWAIGRIRRDVRVARRPGRRTGPGGRAHRPRGRGRGGRRDHPGPRWPPGGAAARRTGTRRRPASEPALDWPDPETRPRF